MGHYACDMQPEWFAKDKQKRKARYIKEGSREWKRREKQVLDAYAPSLTNCKECGSPRRKEYCCLFCGSEKA